MEKLFTKFEKQILPSLKSELKKKNIHEVPRLVKVVISSGIGDFKEDDGAIKKISNDISTITGLKAKVNHSRKAVSAFKLRIGQPVGLTVTLRGEKMFDFLDRLVNVALPRVRDFRGLGSKSFDGNGNYSLGIKEQVIFPEIKYEEVAKPFGFQINIKTTAKNDADTKALLSALGFPFEKGTGGKAGTDPAKVKEVPEEQNRAKSSEVESAPENDQEKKDDETSEKTLNGAKEQNG